MNHNLLNFTSGVLIAMAFINFATGATNFNKQVFETQLGSDVSGNVQNSADRGERTTPALQPVVVDNEIRQSSIRPGSSTTSRPPRSPGSTFINLPERLPEIRSTTTPVPVA